MKDDKLNDLSPATLHLNMLDLHYANVKKLVNNID